MIERAVLDASALLAYLRDETGSDAVESVLSRGGGVVSTVNYAEVVGKLLESGVPEPSVRIVMDNLELHIAAMDEIQAWETGLLRMESRALGLSLGDRACLALARSKKLPAMTADKQWGKLALVDLEIMSIR